LLELAARLIGTDLHSDSKRAKQGGSRTFMKGTMRARCFQLIHGIRAAPICVPCQL
jgi:hypothetical protein